MRNVRLLAGARPSQPQTMKRSTVASDNSIRSSSSPSRSPKPASFPAANNNAFARAGVPGAALATTSRAHAAADLDNDPGA